MGVNITNKGFESAGVAVAIKKHMPAIGYNVDDPNNFTISLARVAGVSINCWMKGNIRVVAIYLIVGEGLGTRNWEILLKRGSEYPTCSVATGT